MVGRNPLQNYNVRKAPDASCMGLESSLITYEQYIFEQINCLCLFILETVLMRLHSGLHLRVQLKCIKGLKQYLVLVCAPATLPITFLTLIRTEVLFCRGIKYFSTPLEELKRTLNISCNIERRNPQACNGCHMLNACRNRENIFGTNIFNYLEKQNLLLQQQPHR